MNRLFGIVGIAVLVVLAGCVGSAQPATSEEDAVPGTISVSGTGELTADPDVAVVRLAVVATADTADEARDSVAADAASMRDALRELGVADDAVSTSGFFIGEDFRDRDGDSAQWRAQHTFRVEVDDVSMAGAVIDAAVENGVDQVHGVQFTLSDEKRAELRDDAVGAAMDAARADANAAADAAGLSVTGVHSISVGNGGVVVPFDARAETMDGASTVIEPGSVSVTAHVSVVYTTNA